MALRNRPSSWSTTRFARLGLILLLFGAAGLVRWVQAPDEPSRSTPPAADTSSGTLLLQRSFDEGRSDVIVESGGTVSRILPDDEVGSRHQRFVVTLASGQTVLLSHNIDLAERVPVERGDPVEFRGEYEWNERGGVVHWTHHDPRGRRPGGWIRFRGKTYR